MTIAPVIIVLCLMGIRSDRRASLIEADRAVAEAARTKGLRAALAAVWAEDAVLLHAGAPVLRGRAVIERFLLADRTLDSLTLTWAPTEAFVSADGGFGATAGEISIDGPGEPGHGNYIAVWRVVIGRWRIVALAQVGLTEPTNAPYDPQWGPKELPPAEASGPAAAMIRADLEFAAHAASSGAAVAFQEYAADGAFMWAGPDKWNRGPEAIGAAIAGGAPSDWVWFPVVGFTAASGDLGATIGQAVIRPRAGGEPRFSKYLTVWRRDADGVLKFLTDGGNPRPKP